MCLSLANLLCLGMWRVMLAPGYANLYFFRSAGHWRFFVSGVVIFVCLGLALYSSVRLARGFGSRRVRRAMRWGLLFLTLVALNTVRHGVPGLSRERLLVVFGGPGGFVIGAAIALVVVWAGLRWPDRFWPAIASAWLALSPFAIVTSTSALLAAVRSQTGLPPLMQDRPSLPILDGTPRRRVVLVIFDELDQTAAFDRREPGVALPELDELRERSVWAPRAYPPSNNTWTSVPALFTGLPVFQIQWVGPAELLLRVRGEARERRWSQEASIFTRARGLGLNAGLVGWGHPYCRVIGASLASCDWSPYVPSPGASVRESVLTHLTLILEAVPGVARLDLRRGLRVGRAYRTTPAHHREQYLRVHGNALRLVGDPRFALVVAHYPVPHDPFIWDRERRAFRTDGAATYTDNLALADLALGELRNALDNAGLTSSTTLVVTGDHWRRATGGQEGPSLGDPRHRVPLLVHLPGQAEEIRVHEVLQTTLLNDLVVQLLQGGLCDAQSAGAWLSQRSQAPPGARVRRMGGNEEHAGAED